MDLFHRWPAKLICPAPVQASGELALSVVLRPSQGVVLCQLSRGLLREPGCPRARNVRCTYQA